MTADICGNCVNFKPKSGERLFNCTSARHAGLNYGMQVRADTRSCDGFMPFAASPAPAPLPPQEHAPSEERLPPVKLCSRGRTIIIIALAIAVILLTWQLVSCASNLITTTPTATPTPATTPAPTGGATPTPTLTPIPITYLKLGEWVESSVELVTVASATRQASYRRYAETFRAPAGTWYVIVNASVRNNGNRTLYVSHERFTLLDSEGHVYTASSYNATDGFPYGELPSGKIAYGKVLYVVPKPFAGSGLEVHYSLRGTPLVKAAWQLW